MQVGEARRTVVPHVRLVTLVPGRVGLGVDVVVDYVRLLCTSRAVGDRPGRDAPRGQRLNVAALCPALADKPLSHRT